MAGSIEDEILILKDEMIQIRRDFHQHPELGFEEKGTARIISKYLTNLGLKVQTGIAGTGVVGLLSGKNPGNTLLVRADMDALPIQEQKEVQYKSQNNGVMHACGHDGHMAIALTVAKILSHRRKEFSGHIKFVFQPAEEGPGGAKPMIDAGVMKGPKVDAAIGLHLWNNLPIGTIGIRSGPTMAGEDMAFFLREVPGCFFFVGSANKAKGLSAKHHSPFFDFDEEAMVLGTEIMTKAALNYLRRI